MSGPSPVANINARHARVSARFRVHWFSDKAVYLFPDGLTVGYAQPPASTIPENTVPRRSEVGHPSIIPKTFFDSGISRWKRNRSHYCYNGRLFGS
jgi:hypothetical protein